jgi:hypothetical protein
MRDHSRVREAYRLDTSGIEATSIQAGVGLEIHMAYEVRAYLGGFQEELQGGKEEEGSCRKLQEATGS